MQKVLFLDDMEDRHKIFQKKFGTKAYITHAYDYDSFVKIISEEKFDMMFLDHDLSETAIMCDPDNVDERTGTDAAELIAKTVDPKNLEIIVHSLNPVGRKRMVQILSDAGFSVKGFPFYHLIHWT